MPDALTAFLAFLGAVWLLECVGVSILLCLYDRDLRRAKKGHHYEKVNHNSDPGGDNAPSVRRRRDRC